MFPDEPTPEPDSSSVAQYMRAEIDTLLILLWALEDSRTISSIAVERLQLAADRLDGALQYLTRGA